MVVLLLTLSIASYGLSQDVEKVKPSQLQGKYITDDSEAFYTFTGDSLYIDCAGSGCGIHAYSLRYTKNDFSECNVEETVVDLYTGREFKERHHFKFLKYGNRVYVIVGHRTVDVIKKVLP
jgi:hypothetical protein